MDTISIRPLEHHLKNSFVVFSLAWHNICNSIFGFPKVRTNKQNPQKSSLNFSQGSSFMKFVLEAAKVHFAEANFERLKVPQRFGPTFFTTTLVSNDCHA